MPTISQKEKEIILKLFKDFTRDYNPSSISNELDISRVGAFKALKKLENMNMVKSRKLGKARFYTLNLENDYARKNVEVILMEEAIKKQRWIDEFKELFNHVQIVVLFGSIISFEDKAKDIDILLVLEQEQNKQVNHIIESKNKMLLKRIHPIKQTKEDLKNNIKKEDHVIMDAIKKGIVLYGVEEYVELIKDVTSRK